MSNEIFQFILPLLVVFTLLVAFFVYLLTKLPGAYWFKWVGIPVFLIASFFSYNIYESKLGRSVPLTSIPNTEFALIGGRIIGRERIELWIVDNTRQTRLVHTPYDHETAKQLDKALDKLRKGIPQMGKGKGKGGQGFFGKFFGKDGRDGLGNGDGKDGKKDGKKGGSRDHSDEHIFYDYPHQRDLGEKPEDRRE